MAEVFAATAHGVEGFMRRVAIKRLRPELSRDEHFVELLRQEARLQGLLHHDAIAAVFDFDGDDQGQFLVMERVDGVDLRQLVSRGPLPPSLVAHIGVEILAGLAHAHELEVDGQPLGLVHRDVSPHNVMVSWDGGVKLIDFGVAEVARAEGPHESSLTGKLAYMSPEQALGLPLDGRSDVFSLGLVLHELLTGRRVFASPTPRDVRARLLRLPIPRPRDLVPGLAADFDEVLTHMLARDRGARFSARVAHEALLTISAIEGRGRRDLGALVRQHLDTDRSPQSVHDHGARPASRSQADTASTLTVSLPRDSRPPIRRAAQRWRRLIAAIVTLVGLTCATHGDHPQAPPAAAAQPATSPTPAAMPPPSSPPSEPHAGVHRIAGVSDDR